MAEHLTEHDARRSLTEHAAEKGAELFAKYGPNICGEDLPRILEDRAFVRDPCDLAFDASMLEPGEFAHPVAKGEQPEDGFTLCIHPVFRDQSDQLPLLVFYQLVLVNYGPFASSDDAEGFGAAALGMDREEYYRAICRLADQLSD